MLVVFLAGRALCKGRAGQVLRHGRRRSSPRGPRAGRDGARSRDGGLSATAVAAGWGAGGRTSSRCSNGGGEARRKKSWSPARGAAAGDPNHTSPRLLPADEGMIASLQLGLCEWSCIGTSDSFHSGRWISVGCR